MKTDFFIIPFTVKGRLFFVRLLYNEFDQVWAFVLFNDEMQIQRDNSLWRIFANEFFKHNK